MNRLFGGRRREEERRRQDPGMIAGLGHSPGINANLCDHICKDVRLFYESFECNYWTMLPIPVEKSMDGITVDAKQDHSDYLLGKIYLSFGNDAKPGVGLPMGTHLCTLFRDEPAMSRKRDRPEQWVSGKINMNYVHSGIEEQDTREFEQNQDCVRDGWPEAWMGRTILTTTYDAGETSVGPMGILPAFGEYGVIDATNCIQFAHMVTGGQR